MVLDELDGQGTLAHTSTSDNYKLVFSHFKSLQKCCTVCNLRKGEEEVVKRGHCGMGGFGQEGVFWLVLRRAGVVERKSSEGPDWKREAENRPFRPQNSAISSNSVLRRTKEGESQPIPTVSRKPTQWRFYSFWKLFRMNRFCFAKIAVFG